MDATIETTKAIVTAVSWAGVTIEVNSRQCNLTWDLLNEAANQDDPELRRVYNAIRVQARRLAGEKKSVCVVVCNHTGDVAGNIPVWYALIQDMAGETIRIDATHGQTGFRATAEREARELRAKLHRRGYDVRS